MKNSPVYAYGKAAKGSLVFKQIGKVAEEISLAELNAKQRVLVKPTKGKAYIVPLLDCTVEVTDIPETWRNILELNAGATGLSDIGVCLVGYTTPLSTTLFHRSTGARLEASLVEYSHCSVKLWDGADCPCDDKPDDRDMDATYKVGPVYLNMESDSYN